MKADEAGLESYTTYKALKAESNKLTTSRLRRTYYLSYLFRHLNALGGTWLWLALIVICFIVLLGASSLSQPIGEIIDLVCATIISYLALLLVGGPYTSLYLVLHPDSERDTFYDNVAGKLFSRFTLLFVLPVLVVVIVALGIIRPTLARQLVAFLSLLALLSYLAAVFSMFRQSLIDFRELAFLVMGRPSAVAHSPEELVQILYLKVRKMFLPKSRLRYLVRLTEIDLQGTELRLQLVNLSIAVIAIIISIVFSERIASFFADLINTLNTFFISISQYSSAFLFPNSSFESAFATGVYFVLWMTVISFILAFIQLVGRVSLLFYFADYRSAFALNQALLLLEADNPRDWEHRRRSMFRRTKT